MLRSWLLRIRFALFPAGSRAERFYHLIRVALFTIRTQGWGALLERIRFEMRFRGFTNDPNYNAALLYRQWIQQNEPGRLALFQQRQACKSWTFQPLISIVTPVYNPEPAVLKDTIQSVLKQTYPNWEFCLANGASDRPGVQAVLDDFAQQDTRIRVIHLEQNLGIAANTNAAVRLARGEFLAFLDHDDLLAPDMLYEVVKCLGEHPDADLVYFDEDKISADGAVRNDPWFKPTALSPDLLLSTNYWMHSVIRRSLIHSLGEYDSTMDGAQDWDMALRILEGQPTAIHIPKIFYHWRQVEGSASRDANAKPWAFPAQKRCIEAHLRRLGYPAAEVEFPSLGTVHIRWPVSGKLVSIIIPTKDKVSVLQACLDSILSKTSYPNFEILIVDTGSVEPETAHYYSQLQAETRLRLLHYSDIFNYQAVNNFAVRFARGDLLVFLNNDTEVINADWLTELVGWIERPEIGIAGAKLIRPDGTLQHAGLVMGLAGHGSHAFDGARAPLYGPFGSTEWYRNYQVVTGACFAMRREVFDRLNGFDEIYQVGYGDIDLCLRATDAGYRVIYTPFANLIHHEGATRRFSQPPADVLRATARMYPRIASGDPYYSPNLSILQRVPSIREPYPVSRDMILYRILQDFDLVAEVISAAPLDSIWTEQIDGYHVAPGSQPRALFITHELTLTGAPMILLRFVRELVAHGVKVFVVAPVDGPLRQTYESLGIEIRLMANILRDARTVLWMLRDYDFVFANTILAYRAVHAARAFNKPCFWWIHESQFGADLARTNPAIAAAFEQASAVIFPANTTADLYRAYTRRSNFHIIHNGGQLPPVDAAATSHFHSGSEKLKLISVASIESRKGQDVLLDALALLPPEIQEIIDCLLIGRPIDWVEPEYCRQVAQRVSKLPYVRLTGPLPIEQVGAHLQAADIFILPSRDEVLPMSIVEAMAFGKPVLTTRVGGIPEVVTDGIDGLIVPAEDPQAMATQLLALTQPELRRRLGETARQTFQSQFTIERFHARMSDLIESTLAAYSPAPEPIREAEPLAKENH